MEKENIFYMKDSFYMEDSDDDCSFYLKTNCSYETLTQIVTQAIFISREERTEIAEEYSKYYHKCFTWCLYNIIEYITIDKGYTWEIVKLLEIEW